MSSVSAVGNGNDLLQWLQQLAQQKLQQQTTTTTPTTTTTAVQDSDGDSDGSTSTSTGGVGGSSGHHHHQGIPSQLQNAITSALNSAGSSADPNQVIQTAIENFLNPSSNSTTGTNSPTTTPTTSANTQTAATVTDPASQQSAFAQLLQSDGVSPSQFGQDLLSALQSSPSQGSTIENLLNPSPNSTTPTTASTQTTASQQSVFAQLLQSNGVSPSQFRQDLFSAIQNSQSQGGTIDFAQVFKNFPAGSTIDTTA
jgi:hypothetical protein